VIFFERSSLAAFADALDLSLAAEQALLADLAGDG
jgi:hypothetical protein